MPRLVDSRRGGKCLAYCGYLYHKQLQNTNTTYWKCVNRKKCYGRAITINDSLRVVKTADHTHEPSPETIILKEMESNLKRTQELQAGGMSRCRFLKRELLQSARARYVRSHASFISYSTITPQTSHLCDRFVECSEELNIH